MIAHTANTPQQLHIAPASMGGIDAQQDAGQYLVLAHQRRAADLATTLLMMRAGARVLVESVELATPAGSNTASSKGAN